MASVYALSCADRGGHVAWIAPTYRNSRPLWHAAEKAIAPVANRLKVRRSEREIVFPCGGALYVYSADNHTAMLGMAFDVVIIDEASRIPEIAWTNTIQPTLADRSGKAILISTPTGRNWFYREWLRGREHSDRIASFQAPTSDNPSPQIREAFELAKDSVSDKTFRQEWLAEFVDDAGGVFRGMRSSIRSAKLEAPKPDTTYVAGIDWGLSGDYTVVTIMDQASRSVVHIDRFTGIDYSLQRERIIALCERFGVYVIIAESNAMGKPNNDMLRERGIRVRDFNTSNSSKAQIIESLAAAFDHRTIALYNDRTLIDELEAYEGQRLPSGQMRYSAPEGVHDDTVMSLALAWTACGDMPMFGG